MVALMILLGAFPEPVLRRMEPSVQAVLERVQGSVSAAALTPAGDQE
jgi:hypothetical protein